MKNSEKLKAWIEQGHWVAGQNKDGDWKVFLSVDKDGEFQGTLSRETVYDCLRSSLSTNSYMPEEIDSDWSNFQFETPVPKLIEVGKKVMILENVREIVEKRGGGKKKIEMIGKSGLIIKEVFPFYYSVYSEDQEDHFSFPHWAVAEYFEDEEEITLEEAEKILGKKIKK